MQLVENSIWKMSLVENFQIFYKCAHLSSTDSDRNCRKLSLVDFGGTSLVENIWYVVKGGASDLQFYGTCFRHLNHVP